MKLTKQWWVLVLVLASSPSTYAQDLQWLDDVLEQAAQVEPVNNQRVKPNSLTQVDNDDALVTLDDDDDFKRTADETDSVGKVDILSRLLNTTAQNSGAIYEHAKLENSEVMDVWVDRPEFIDKTVRVNYVDGYAYMEGDIILGAVNTQEKSVASMGKHHSRWPKAIVPYVFDSSLADKKVMEIKAAIAHWQLYTPVRLVERNSEHANYIVFRKSRSGGCSSYVGMKGGMQEINVADWCRTGSIIHEIGHALGLWHEQSRADRDQFIRIDFANITRENRHNFSRHVADGEDVGEYDYASIMHYPRVSFSINDEPTIIPIKADVEIGQRKKLSAGDLAGINKMYPLAAQQPSCTSINQYRAPECVTAMQQACASPLRGGAGISQEVGHDYLSVACFKPNWQGYVQLNRLQSYNSACSDGSVTQKEGCYRAAQKFCQKQHSLPAALLQGVSGSLVNVACFTPKWQGKVSFSVLKTHFSRCTGADKAEKSGCVAAVHRYCLTEHKANAGVVQKIAREGLVLACFTPSIYSNMPLTNKVAYALPEHKPESRDSEFKPNSAGDIEQVLQQFVH